MNPLVVVMEANKTIGASFVKDERDNDGDGLSNYAELVLHNTDPDRSDSDDDGCNDRLEIVENTDPNNAESFPRRRVTVINSQGGRINGSGDYKLASTATLSVVPDEGYRFTGWSGDASDSSASISVSVDAAKTIQANFSPISVTEVINSIFNK